MSNITARHRVTAKIIAAAFALAMAMALVIPSGGAAYAAESDWVFTDGGDGTATITQYVGSDIDVVVPDRLGGAVVVSLGTEVFVGSPIQSVELPGSLISIGDRAFMDTPLATIDLPNGLITIGSYAFAGTLLTSVELPNSLASIESYAFSDAQLTSVDIPDNLSTIGLHVFSSNPLQWVDLPASYVAAGSNIPWVPQVETGQVFDGWYTATGDAVDFTALPAEGGRIYTHWTPETVVLHPNAPDVDMAGVPAPTTYGTPTRPHYGFLGWSLEAHPPAGSALIAGSQARGTGRGIELYAQWAPSTIFVTAVDKEDGDQVIDKAGDVTVFNTVTYSNLNAGLEYLLVTSIVDTETGDAVLDALGNPVQSRLTFTPDAPSGQVQFDTDLNTSTIAGITGFTVVHELFQGTDLTARFGDTAPDSEAVTFAVDLPALPPSTADLTAATQNAITATPAVVQPGDVITLHVPTESAGDAVAVHLFSEPTTLGGFVLSADLDISVQLPADTPAGEHRIAIYRADGSLVGWQTITVEVAAAVPADQTGIFLPATGFSDGLFLAVAAVLIIAGLVLVTITSATGGRRRGLHLASPPAQEGNQHGGNNNA